MWHIPRNFGQGKKIRSGFSYNNVGWGGINKIISILLQKNQILLNKKHSSKREVKQQASKHEQELYNATLTHQSIHTSIKDICIGLVIL